MQIDEKNSIQNPFKKVGQYWLIFSTVAVVAGIIILLLSKSDFTGFKAHAKDKEADFLILFGGRFLLKIVSGVGLLTLGVKYLKISLSALFKFDPGKKLGESLAQEVNEQYRRNYTSDEIFKMLESKDLEQVKPRTTLGNITVRIFKGLKKLPMTYFRVSQNFLNAVISSAAPFLILLVALFLNYLEIIDIVSGNRLEWIMALISISLIFAWSPFSPITNNKEVNQKPLVLTVCSIGMLLIIRTSSLTIGLPEIPFSIFLTTIIFVLLSATVFGLFFFLLKRRIEIETTNDLISGISKEFDVDLNPVEIHRVLSSRMHETGSASVTNRVYKNLFQSSNGDSGSFIMSILHETQPLPRYTIKDSTLTHNAQKISQAGFIGASVGILLFIILTVASPSLVGLFISTILSLGIVNFGLKLIRLSNLFLSEFLFESKLVHIGAKGEFKHAQLTAGRSINDNVQSKNQVSRTSLSINLVSTNIVSVSFMEIGKSDPFEGSPRYIISTDRDDETVEYLTRAFAEHISGKAQIAGITNDRDIQTIKNMSNLNDKNQKNKEKLMDDDMPDLRLSEN